MGWGDCGVDSNDRPIGYVFEGICDHASCGAAINRGLSYACGDMHGETDLGCELYFCEQHRSNMIYDECDSRWIPICDECNSRWEALAVEEFGASVDTEQYTQYGHLNPEVYMELQADMDDHGAFTTASQAFIGEMLHRLQSNSSCHLTAEMISVELNKYDITITKVSAK